jgi:hypothetical protein
MPLGGDDENDYDQEDNGKSLKREVNPKLYQEAVAKCKLDKLIEGTNEFTVCVDNKLGLRTCATSTRGRCVNYTADDPSYEEMDPYDKMNYAVFLLDYNVQEKKEFAEGYEGTKKGFLGEYTSIDWLLHPQKLISLLTFIDFAIIVIMIIILIVMYIADIILSMFGVKVISPIKKSVFMWMILCLVLLYLLIFIVDFVYNKVQNRLEIINYNIK